MNGTQIQISAGEVDAERDDRFHRLGLIPWWEQKRLARAKVLVIGAGALGNELIKNLSLLGVGNLFVVDLDRIENSNLSRSILFRESDQGAFKSDVAARVATEIYPAIRVRSWVGDVIHDLGLGVFRWADVIVAGLDNREARLAINRACWKVGRPWIDGAIEQIQGVARVFVPDGPCYECTMSQTDWDLLQRRRSCNLLSRDEMEHGHTPTTPTISSIIAGMQCQELVKLLHGLPTLRGKGWVFDGWSAASYLVEYQRKADCLSHDPLEKTVELPRSVHDLTAGEGLEIARGLLGEDAVLDFGRDVLEKWVCPRCRREEPLFRSLGTVKAKDATCPHCPETRREVTTFFQICGGESFLERTLSDIGVPPFDILVARGRNRAIGIELSGDRAKVLGPLADDSEDLTWK